LFKRTEGHAGSNRCWMILSVRYRSQHALRCYSTRVRKAVECTVTNLAFFWLLRDRAVIELLVSRLFYYAPVTEKF
jgi:hypothetical protein